MNLPILRALKELIENKLNKSDIVNNLTTSETGKVLAASQGKVLDDRINNLFDKVKLKSYTTNSITDIPTTIKSMDSNSILSGIYTGDILGVSGSFTLFINKQNQDRCSIFATLTGTNKVFIGDYRTTENKLSWANITQIIFTDVTQINPSFKKTTPILEIIKDMPSGSKLEYALYGAELGEFPFAYGVLYINKYERYGADLEIISRYGTGTNANLTRKWISSWQETDTVFKGWKEITTTDKTEILCTPNPNWTVVRQKSYKVNNILFVDVLIKRTDGSAIGVGWQNPFRLSVTGILRHKNIPFTCWVDDGVRLSTQASGGTATIRLDGQVFLINNDNTCTEIQINGPILLEV